MSKTLRNLLATLLMVGASACGRDGIDSTTVLTGARASAATASTGADLQISGSASSGSVTEGAGYTYTFQIKNAGPDSATAVTFTDTLPPGVVYQGAELNGGLLACAQTGQTVSCGLDPIRKGDVATVLVLVNAPTTAGVDTNTAIASSAVSDPQPSNNTVRVVVQVTAPPTAGGGGGGGGGGKVAPVAVSAFSTLPADFNSGGYIIAGGGQGLAFPFVPTATGTWSTLIVAMHGSSAPMKVGFWLYADDPNNPGNPGALITNFFGSAPALDGTLTSIALPKAASPILVAGQKYWLFAAGSAGELSGQWDLSSNVLLTSPVASGSPGFTPTVGPGAGRMAAFQIVVLQ